MYICNNCGLQFASPIPIHEYHDELDDRAIEVFYVCPHCKCDNYEEAVQCDLCGDYVNTEYVELKDGTFVCNNCYILHM